MSKDKKNITNKKIKMINTILIILNILPKNVVPNVNNQVAFNKGLLHVENKPYVINGA